MSFQDQLSADLASVFFSDFAVDVIIAGIHVKAIYLDDPTKWDMVQANGKALSLPAGEYRFRQGDKVEIPSRGVVTSIRQPPVRQDGLLLIPLK